MTPVRRLLPLLLLLLALPALVAACGDDEQASFNAAEAAAATRDAESAKFTMTAEVSGTGLPQPATLRASGVSATAEPRMDMTMDLGPLLQAFGAPGEAKARVLLDGGDVYVDPPALPGIGDLPGGAQWITADLGALARGFGLDGAALGELMRLTPAQQTQALEAADLEEVGEEEIDGTTTTHLRGTVSLEDYLEVLPAERADRVRKAIADFEKLTESRPGELSTPTPTEIWVDEENRLRRMVQDVRTPAQNGTPAGRVKLRFDFTDYGTPLNVRAPATADVFDVTDAIEGQLPKGR